METLELIKRARSGDKLAREQVIEENMGLVYSIVKRFAGRGYDSEELSQIGAIGLIKAVDKFDLRFDVRFSTYAVPLITGEIKRFLRDDGMVRVSRSIKENSWRVKRMAAELSQKLEREPSMDELSAAVELPVEDIVLALEATAEVESLHKPICFQDGKEVSLEEKIPERKDWQEELMNRLIVEELLEQLQTKERGAHPDALLRRKNTEGNCGTSGNQPGSSQSPGEKTAFTDARKNCWKKISKKY